ncbi:MAG: holo-ACP synthase [Alphaproteobacteria bacterium]|nr:holo-ACP synthase [Alphaproteobacteria bacterium]
MIIGVGIDFVKKEHFQKKVEKGGASFIKKVFCPKERERGELLSEDLRLNHYAKRYAAKEAFVKALGTGFGIIGLQDVWVENAPSGQPNLVLSENAQNYMKEKYKRPVHIHLSLSDDEDAIAIVILDLV